MSDIETAREAWIVERPAHSAFGNLIKSRVTASLRPLGIWYEVSTRAKELDSLVKKLLKKPEHTYESLPDKVGARVVVRFRSDIQPVIDVVLGAFECATPDNKVVRLGTDRVGYQSVHLDQVRLREGDPDAIEYPSTRYWVELQVRTLAQHLWSEMSHDTIYKNDETVAALPPDLTRRVNLMAGQIEVADREFDRLNGELPADMAARLLKVLEHHYYTLTSQRSDPELSLQVLGKMAPLYESNANDIATQLDEFLRTKHGVLESVFSEAIAGSNENTTAFLFQPEVLMLYERLLNDPIATRRVWSQTYPESELERVANTFGVSFD
jgi:ppGpp synthetase/RelA/SpoT-type nucleotidyltranferase